MRLLNWRYKRNFSLIRLLLVITLVDTCREPTSFGELLAILQRQNDIKVVASDEDWETIPRTHILVRRGKVLEDALREVRKDRFDPTKLINVRLCCFYRVGYHTNDSL